MVGDIKVAGTRLRLSILHINYESIAQASQLPCRKTALGTKLFETADVRVTRQQSCNKTPPTVEGNVRNLAVRFFLAPQELYPMR